MTTDYSKIGEAFAAIADLRRIAVDGEYARMRALIDGEGPKHWAARVRRDRGQKGGIAREWLARGDEHWYHVADLAPGDVVEIGASAYSLKRLMKAGEKPDRTKRLYRQVAAISDDCIIAVVVDDERGSDRWREVAAALEGPDEEPAVDSTEDVHIQWALKNGFSRAQAYMIRSYVESQLAEAAVLQAHPAAELVTM